MTGVQTCALPILSTIPGATARPCEAKIGFANDLSIATAEASTPEPTYGIFIISHKPWNVPSSPYGPWSNGKTTSIPSVRRSISLPLSTHGSPLLFFPNGFFESNWSHAPSLSLIPIKRGSYALRSIALRTPSAEMQEISCSLLLPPQKIATRLMIYLRSSI